MTLRARLFLRGRYSGNVETGAGDQHTDACDPGDSELAQERFEVPLTAGHIQQLHTRRCDLLDTNLDLLGEIGADRHANAVVMAEIHHNRHGVEALNRIFDAYTDTITT